VESKVSLDSISCIADQGSKFNIINLVLVLLLSLPILSLSNTRKHSLVINIANGKSTPLLIIGIITWYTLSYRSYIIRVNYKLK
jgi:hypothetical protein